MTTDNKNVESFAWVTQKWGPDWAPWQAAAEGFINSQTTGLDPKITSLKWFLRDYLPIHAAYAVDMEKAFLGHDGHKLNADEIMKIRSNDGLNDNGGLSTAVNVIVNFFNYIIDEAFSVENEHGVMVPTVANPLSKVKKTVYQLESVRQALPYRFIRDLRAVISPEKEEGFGNFSDWTWAYETAASARRSGEYFDVEPDLIDTADPDCVWRIRGERYQIWSPVMAMLAFIKTHLPLRTYQIVMLDSGEADTEQYQNGEWVRNLSPFARGTVSKPFAKGVFRKVQNQLMSDYSTGMYINTNKTADQNKNELGRGYVIPWQNEEVLYWLEKLRNWQMKYNPIQKPASCTDLQTKHFDQKKTTVQKQALGEVCFLFRDPTASSKLNRTLPVPLSRMQPYWYKLMSELETQLHNRGILLEDGKPIQLVNPASKKETYYPPHSMRVSLITAYTMDTHVPLPVISKLLAGHSRLLMTIYYNKISPSAMKNLMAKAEAQLLDSEQESLKAFLTDASMNQIRLQAAYNNALSVEAALENANPLGLDERAYGICLAGGNKTQVENSSVAGCWNGGELLQNAKQSSARVYAPVPHGSENCVRCRWFITGAQYLPALTAHFNQLGYSAHKAANIAVELEGDLNTLLDEQIECELNDIPFTKNAELSALQKRHETLITEANEFTKDWIACFELVNRVLDIERARTAENSSNKLVAVGRAHDIAEVVKLDEISSELLHLAILCDDAEVFPALGDRLKMTSAVEKRNRLLDKALMLAKLPPLFVSLSDKEQLVAGNAFMRQMVKLADTSDKLEGYKKVCGYLEGKEFLQDSKLLNKAIEAAQCLSENPIKLIS